jgi:hypothetical protein
VTVARKLSKAIFWVPRAGTSYRELEPYLAPRGQVSSGLYIADR